uniref:Putative secreted protein n=1 Tax=Xenopsylla cheopis TaxID=163159 RepID=A0A6M2DZB3_XENCH
MALQPKRPCFWGLFLNCSRANHTIVMLINLAYRNIPIFHRDSMKNSILGVIFRFSCLYQCIRHSSSDL